MKQFLITACLLAMFSAANAQSTSTSSKETIQATATAQASFLAQELGLDTRQTALAQELMGQAERDVIPLRAECAKIQTQVDAAYSPYYAKLKTGLTKEQQEKLTQLERSGKLSVGCGMSGMSCDHAKPGMKGNACCAGGKASTSTTPATNGKPAPQQTTLK